MSALQEKNKRIDKTVVLLREKHSGRFTTIQYCLWAEMLDVGTHRCIYIKYSAMMHNNNYCVCMLI